MSIRVSSNLGLRYLVVSHQFSYRTSWAHNLAKTLLRSEEYSDLCLHPECTGSVHPNCANLCDPKYASILCLECITPKASLGRESASWGIGICIVPATKRGATFSCTLSCSIAAPRQSVLGHLGLEAYKQVSH